MAELGQQTVDFSTLVSRAAEDSFVSFKELVEKSRSGEQSDSERKIGLLKYLVKTRQRMLRLNVLAKWCKQVSFLLLLLWRRCLNWFATLRVLIALMNSCFRELGTWETGNF
ncbi:unnamed protein product [Linum tenue]|uniref:Mediator of RNA polymerase II transcription subunit 14 n=1 Tax=Linum tenue TaxID=586396 RepID=A0AAV0LEA9_9ROSI|nr:unnamed protein product [Linum tenue]